MTASQVDIHSQKDIPHGHLQIPWDNISYSFIRLNFSTQKADNYNNYLSNDQERYIIKAQSISIQLAGNLKYDEDVDY